MIVLNRLAKKCLKMAYQSNRVTPESGTRKYLLQALVKLNESFDCTKFAHAKLPQWSEYEFSVAEVISWLLTFLERFGCRDIEQLIRDVIAYRHANPDTLRKKHD